MRLFLGGDTMLGRGVDQVLPWPAHPALAEEWVKDARDYVRLAEERLGEPIARGRPLGAIWGDLLEVLDASAPVARIVNLETSITRRGSPWPGKSVCYRVSPENAACLGPLRADVCSLANNHVLDFGVEGFEDTLAALSGLGIAAVGAGADLAAAQAPARIQRGDRAIVVIGCGTGDCGIPASWGARSDRAGVALVDPLEGPPALAAQVRALAGGPDRIVVSIHWGSNWGHDVPEAHVELAHTLIDAGADLVHGHSSHHPRAIEVYRERLILYGCGELIDDYEGIDPGDRRGLRSDLVIAWLPLIDPAGGALLELEMIPLRIRRLRLEHASASEAAWLARTLDDACARFGTRVVVDGPGRLALRWTPSERAGLTPRARRARRARP